MKKVIGVWLDHSKAKLIKLQDGDADNLTSDHIDFYVIKKIL